MTAITDIAEFVSQAEPDQSLTTVVAPAIVDCFGAIIAGADSVVANRVYDAVGPIGAGTSPLYGSDRRLAPGYAAMMNAVAGHAYDLDDWEIAGNTHPTVVLLPALLAASDIVPQSGQALLQAYVVGVEVICRVGLAIGLDHYARGFHATATLGALGAAAAVARTLGLDQSQTGHALALATSQASGYTTQFGSNAKALQAGVAARAGLEAALMARTGVTGQYDVLDSPRGFAGLMGRTGEGYFGPEMAKLGQPWALQEYGLLLKPWPSCAYAHRLMTAALELRFQLMGRTDRVIGIHAVLPDFHRAILPYQQPATRDEALFSLPACISQILAAGDLTLSDGAGKFWQNSEVARLIDVTTITTEPAMDRTKNFDANQPDRLILSLDNGATPTATCAFPLGAPQNPMSTSQLSAKFNTISGLPADQFTTLLNWPDVSNVSEFFSQSIH